MASVLRFGLFLAFAALFLPCAGARSPAEFALFLDAQEAENRLVAVGERGLILVSTDLGRTWASQSSGLNATLTAVAHSTDGTWWVGGHEGALLRSRATADQWAPVTPTPLQASDAVFSIQPLDTQEVLVAGAFGLLARCGGASPERLPSPAGDLHLYTSVQEAGEILWFGESGAALRGMGQEWAILDLGPDAPSIHGALRLKSGTLLVFGLRGHLLRKAGLEPFEPSETGTTGLLSTGVELPDGRVLLAGQSGAVLLGAEDGRVWRPATLPYPGAVSQLRLLSDGALLILGETGIRRVEAKELP